MVSCSVPCLFWSLAQCLHFPSSVHLHFPPVDPLPFLLMGMVPLLVTGSLTHLDQLRSPSLLRSSPLSFSLRIASFFSFWISFTFFFFFSFSLPQASLASCAAPPRWDHSPRWGQGRLIYLFSPLSSPLLAFLLLH